MLFASIRDSFLAQALVLLLFQYPATLSGGNGPDLFLQSGPFQISINFLGIDLVSIIYVRCCSLGVF